MEKKLKKLVTNELTLKNNIDVDEDKIIGGQLTWFPWVGSNYTQSKQKVLVVGESHYYSDLSAFPEHTDPKYTRMIVECIGVADDRKNKKSATMFRNFYFSMRQESQTKESFWNDVAFYNFIQQPMNSIQQRPNYEMVLKAWQSFENLIALLKPDKVVFIGVKACDGYNDCVSKLASFEGYSPLKVDAENKISNRQVPRLGSVTFNNKNIPIHFIKHSSAYYSWSKWRDYFKKYGLIEE